MYDLFIRPSVRLLTRLTLSYPKLGVEHNLNPDQKAKGLQ